MKEQSCIAGGHVFCRPLQRDMDVAQCFACPRLRTLGVQASPPFIECDTNGVPQTVDDHRARAEWRIQHHQRT